MDSSNEWSNHDDKVDVIKFILKENELPSDCPLAEQDVLDYVSHLSSLGLAQLVSETTKLKNENSLITEKTQDLAFQNYKSFITTSNCSSEAFKDVMFIQDRIENVIKTVPEFVKKCTSFSNEAKSISKRWRESSLMLSKHIQLLEILEIPQLMDNCVRNCYYEEALQLYCYVERFNKKHGQNIPLIAMVANNVEMIQESMLNQLLKELNGNVQLPGCIKIISYLRRMNKFTESELRIKFLIARDSWLQTIIKEINQDNPMVHLTKTIEANRVYLFDIVTQYRAIFADQEPIISSKIKYFAIYSVSSNQFDFNDSAIICSWINHKINQFYQLLKMDLDKCLALNRNSNSKDGNFGYQFSMENISESCYYFGQSMSRIGADIWPELYQILNKYNLINGNTSHDTMKSS